jgi:hypothetical protein
MSADLTPHHRRISDHLPSLVYKSAAGAVVLFVILAWIFFGGAGYVRLLLTVVSGLFFMVLAIPFALWLTWQRHREPEEGDPISSREWASGEFATGQDHLKGANAAAEILLPIVATAVGMLAIGTVFFVVSAGAS